MVQSGTKRFYRLSVEDYPQMLLQDDYIRLLTESGFHQITVYGGYRFDPDNPEPAIGGSAIVQRVSQARQTADSAAMM